MKLMHILTIVGAMLGAAQLSAVFSGSSISAPQQAAGSAMAVALAVIPYCFARAWEIMANGSHDELKKLNATLETHTRLLASLANDANRKSKAAESTREL